ncbi:MAG TPA: hypothetical protein VE971_02470 [Candidatus Eisenbacteria bacterium]|nr:hypothetical protein [Candidatus Eisenbacteria bacterium]
MNKNILKEIQTLQKVNSSTCLLAADPIGVIRPATGALMKSNIISAEKSMANSGK